MVLPKRKQPYHFEPNNTVVFFFMESANRFHIISKKKVFSLNFVERKKKLDRFMFELEKKTEIIKAANEKRSRFLDKTEKILACFAV